MKYLLTLLLLVPVLLLNAQTNPVRVNSQIVLPKDSTESKNLISSLNSFLLAVQRPNEENKFVFEEERMETLIQIEAMNGLAKSGQFKDDFFYQPYLTNVMPLTGGNYLIQIAYIGSNKDTAYLRGSFEFIAHNINNTFTFSSPLLSNTRNWKVLKIGNHIFHYQNDINKEKVLAYTKLTHTFDTKLKVPNKTTDYYLCDNVVALNKLIGIDYKLEYNGRKEGHRTVNLGDRRLSILGDNNECFNKGVDLHDLFHDRLSLVIPRNKVNKPVDEGCAYLYGGSWGFSWNEIFKAFKAFVASNPNVNWSEIKEKDVRFSTGNYTNSVDNIINALLVKKIEREKGFAGVWELLNVGPVEKGNEKYYQTLEKLTGISKANYNEKIWELIHREE